jgi:hypothetical protein
MNTTVSPPPTARRSLSRAALLVTALVALATPAHAVSEATLRGLRVPAANAVIPIADILSGGPPPQGIPALGFRGLTGVAGPAPEPRFVDPGGGRPVARRARARGPGARGGEARLYPLQILTWHEIANDTLGGVPVAVSFCPLCNSALAHDRRVPVTEEQVEALRARGTPSAPRRSTPTPPRRSSARPAGRRRPSPSR